MADSPGTVSTAPTPVVRARPLGALLLHAVLFAVLAAWSWLKWPDPVVDFGRELYVPWQLTQGKVLYRDIESIYGPLSPYVNALWMRLFGVSLLTLVVCNLAVFAATLAGVHILIRRSTDALTASVASLTVLIVSGFLQLDGIGNYNFVTPYAHEATHGIAMSVGLLLAWHAALTSGRTRFSAAAGLLFGSVLMTKPEILLAATAAVGTSLVIAVTHKVTEPRNLRTILPVFAFAAAVPPSLFAAYLARHMTAAAAFEGVAGAVTTALNPSIAANMFYVAGMGLDRPGTNAARMLLGFGAFLGFATALIAVCWTGWRGKVPQLIPELGRPIVLMAAVLFWLVGMPRALPLIVLSTLATVIALLGRRRDNSEQSQSLLLLLMWTVYALALLAKVGLNARLEQYGFYLSLPAVTVLVVALCWLIPEVLNEQLAPAIREFRVLAAMACGAAVLPLLVTSNTLYRAKTTAIGSGGDRFYANTAAGSHAAELPATLDAIKSVASPGDMLAVLPEGVMVNYLTRLESPLRVVNFMPPELAIFGEDEVLGAIQRAPPRFVLFVHRDTSEYQYPLFGTDERYGARTLGWIVQHYRPIRTIGERPLETTGRGVVLFERALGAPF
jgi:hypothetical protein